MFFYVEFERYAQKVQKVDGQINKKGQEIVLHYWYGMVDAKEAELEKGRRHHQKALVHSCKKFGIDANIAQISAQRAK